MTAWQTVQNIVTTNRVTTILDLIAFALATPQILGGKKGLEKFERIVETFVISINFFPLLLISLLMGLLISRFKLFIDLLVSVSEFILDQFSFGGSSQFEDLFMVLVSATAIICLSNGLLSVLDFSLPMVKATTRWLLVKMEKDDNIAERWLFIGAVIFLFSSFIKFLVG